MQPFLLKKSLKIQRTLKELEVMYQNATYNVFLDNHECDKQVCDNHECLKSEIFSFVRFIFVPVMRQTSHVPTVGRKWEFNGGPKF